MNYATALTLPGWATEAQVYSHQLIRFTPVVLKAFSKTIAPVMIESVKGFSRHWFESECYWRQRIANFAGITYNPLTASISAARAELTSSEAQATYRHIQHITRETAMDALVVGLCGIVAVATTIEAAQTVYRHAAAFYSRVDAWLNPAPVILPSAEMALASTELAAALAIAADVAEAQSEADAEPVPDFWAEPMPLIHTPHVFGPIWNPAPGRDMHEEVERLLELQHVLLTLAAAPVVEQSVPEPVKQSARRGRGQAKVSAAPAIAEDEMATAFDVPGATGKDQRNTRGKAGTSNAAAAKPEGATSITAKTKRKTIVK